MLKSVVYIGNFIFPDGNASGKRVCGNLMAIKAAGYKVYAIGFNQSNETKTIEKNIYEGITYYSLPQTRNLKRIFSYKQQKIIDSIIDRINSEDPIKMIIMYGSMGSVFLNFHLLNKYKKKGILFSYDQVDFYERLNKNKPLRNIFKYFERSLFPHMLKRCDSYIAISNYLKKTMPYPNRCIVIPPLSSALSNEIRPHKGTNIVLTYASYISDVNRPVSEWKDRIDIIIDVIYNLHKRGINNLSVNFVGFSRRTLVLMFEERVRNEYVVKLEQLSSTISFVEECANKQVQEILKDSDFTILIRDSKLSTNAGFPTKVSESVSMGIPPIVNITSDIGEYIHNGENGIVLDNIENYSDIEEKIFELTKMTPNELYSLKKSTLESKVFYYSNFVNKFRLFLNM